MFFSDVVGFSTISEELDPQALIDWLNEYMALMTHIINEHNGVILRFIGDAKLKGKEQLTTVYRVHEPKEATLGEEQALSPAPAIEASATHSQASAVTRSIP